MLRGVERLEWKDGRAMQPVVRIIQAFEQPVRRDVADRCHAVLPSAVLTSPDAKNLPRSDQDECQSTPRDVRTLVIGRRSRWKTTGSADLVTESSCTRLSCSGDTTESESPSTPSVEIISGRCASCAARTPRMSSVKWAPGAVLARWTSVNGHGRLESNAASATTPKKTTAVPKPSVLAMARHTVHRTPIESRIMREAEKQ